MPSPSRPAPFHPRNYSLPDAVEGDPVERFWHEPPARLTFIDDAEDDIRGVTRAMIAGMICGFVVCMLIWWWQA